MMALLAMCLPGKTGWTLLLVVLVGLYLDCVICTENTTQGEGRTSTTDQIDVATQGNEEKMTHGGASQERGTTVTDSMLGSPTSESPTPNTEQYEYGTTSRPTFGTGEHTDVPSGSLTPQNNGNQPETTPVTAVGTTKPSNSSKRLEIHWLLFTGWEMPVVLACIEIMAYLITIFIVFGFSKKRSKVKRFGHFSWKRPNPFANLDEVVSLPVSQKSVAGSSHAGHDKLRPKKPSIRGHVP